MLSVTQNNIADIANTQAVYHNLSHRHSSGNLRLIFVDLQHLTQLHHKDVIFIHPHGNRQILMTGKVHEFPMDRHEELRLCQRQHQLQLLLTGVTGNVDILNISINHVCTLFQQLIHHARNAFFIPRNGRCTDDNFIIGLYVNLLMLAGCNTGQSGHCLPLAACRNNNQLIVPIISCFVNINQRSGRNPEIIQLGCRFHRIDHTATDNGNLSAVHICRIDNLLNTMDV